ncbi:MAG: beta-phosphoglucomutase [Chloroflexi bacterium]|nr:beta-phosphoglucomutase [Chloroflexota bacterium]
MTLDIRAFLFDLDGVITDTAEFHYLSWKRLCEEEGIPFTREDNDQLRGVSRRESLNRILKGRAIDEATAQAWMDRKQGYYLQYLDTITPDMALPGVRDLLLEAKSLGIKRAVASASKNAKPALEKLELIDLFDAIGDGYSVVHTKPAPDLFIWTAGRLDITPTQGIVFEDAEAGIDAALKGGFWTIGLGSADVSRAHVRLPNLAGARVGDLLAKLSEPSLT